MEGENNCKDPKHNLYETTTKSIENIILTFLCAYQKNNRATPMEGFLSPNHFQNMFTLVISFDHHKHPFWKVGLGVSISQRMEKNEVLPQSKKGAHQGSPGPALPISTH